jgi:acyl-CoA reductase-like NAD-dependent aldehyde dehydrogenase
MADLGEEYAARAAVFRRLAAELRSEADRLALLAVAEEYEAEAERLKAPPGPV